MRIKKIFFAIVFSLCFAYGDDNSTTQLVMKDGIVYDNNDKPFSGEIEEYFADGGLKTSGSFIDGLRSGEWIIYYPNGIIKEEIEYFNGKKNGVYRLYDVNGKIFIQSHYKEDSLNGLYEEFTKDGKYQSKGEYKGNRKNGYWTEFYDNGNAVKSVFYIDDKPAKAPKPPKPKKTASINDENTYVEYHDNGNIKIMGQNIDGKKNGVWREYHYHGNLKSVKVYKDGDEYGMQKKYDYDGKVEEATNTMKVEMGSYSKNESE